MKNLQALATELASNKMTLLVANDMLNIKGGKGCGGGSKKKSGKKSKKSRKSRKSNKGGGYGGGCGCSCGYSIT